MRHAFLIMCHGDCGTIAHTISILDSVNHDFFVHVDAKSGDFDEDALRSVLRHSKICFVAPRIRVNWGGVSIVRAEIALLDAAVKGGYDYYHLLSGADLPIKSAAEIDFFFERNSGLEYVQCHPVTGHTLRRVRCFTIFPEGASNPLKMLLNNALKLVLDMLGLHMNRDVDFMIGSQWFSITGAFASYVVSRKEWIENTFRHSVLCDEIFLPTVLASSPFASHCAGRNLRFIDWDKEEGHHRHPYTFRISDFDELMGREELFARKFDERTDCEIIERISEKVKSAR